MRLRLLACVGGIVIGATLVSCHPITTQASPQTKTSQSSTLSIRAVPVSSARAQGVMDSGDQCTTVQFTETTDSYYGYDVGVHYVLGHGNNAFNACNDRAHRWFTLPYDAVVVIKNGPFAGRYRVAHHYKIHDDSQGYSVPPRAGPLYALVMGSCLNDSYTGWTVLRRAR